MTRDDQMTVDMAVMDFMRDHPDAPMAKIIRVAVEAAEPLIREDERNRMADLARKVPGGGIIDVRGLRAAVRALPDRGLEIPHATGTEHTLVYRDDVLALLDGGTP